MEYIRNADNWHELKELPADVQSVDHLSSQLLITLRSAWTTAAGVFAAGALVAVDIHEFVSKGAASSSFVMLFEPPADGRVSLNDCIVTKSYVVYETLDNVKSRLHFWKWDAESSAWLFCGSEYEARPRGLSISAVDSTSSNEFWLNLSSFLQVLSLCIRSAAVSCVCNSRLRCACAMLRCYRPEWRLLLRLP